METQQITLQGIILLLLAILIGIRFAWPYLFRARPRAATRDTPAARSAAENTPPPAFQATPPPPAPADAAAIPTARAAMWLAYVNDIPDAVPHIALCAPSGSGKTTLARAILGQRDGQIVVLTAKEGDDWGGVPYVGIDDDATYTTAEQTFQQLDAEVKRRLIAAKRQTDVGDWLTVVLDDYSTLRSVCPAADAPFKLIARLGRSLHVRLMVLSDSALVKAWGLEGEGETRNNFVFLIGKRGHSFSAALADTTYLLDTSDVPRLAQVMLAARTWTGTPHAPAAAALMTIPVRAPLGGAAMTENTGTVRYGTEPVSGSTMPNTGGTALVDDATDTIPDDDEAHMIRALRDAGFSRNKICMLLGGSKTTAMARIKRAVGDF